MFRLRPGLEGIPTPKKSQPVEDRGRRDKDQIRSSYNGTQACSLILLASSGIPGYPEPSGPTGKGGRREIQGAWGAPSSSDLVPEFSGHLPVHGWGRSRLVSAQFAPAGARLPETVTVRAWERRGGAWPVEAGRGQAAARGRHLSAPRRRLRCLFSHAPWEQVGCSVCVCGGGWAADAIPVPLERPSSDTHA